MRFGTCSVGACCSSYSGRTEKKIYAARDGVTKPIRRACRRRLSAIITIAHPKSKLVTAQTPEPRPPRTSLPQCRLGTHVLSPNSQRPLVSIPGRRKAPPTPASSHLRCPNRTRARGKQGGQENPRHLRENPTLALALTGFWPPSGSRGRGQGTRGAGMYRSISPGPPSQNTRNLKKDGARMTEHE